MLRTPACRLSYHSLQSSQKIADPFVASNSPQDLTPKALFCNYRKSGNRVGRASDEIGDKACLRERQASTQRNSSLISRLTYPITV